MYNQTINFLLSILLEEHYNTNVLQVKLAIFILSNFL